MSINMDKIKQKSIIEAVLFTMGGAVEIQKLAELIEENVKTTKAIIGEIKEDMEMRESGLTIIELDHSYQMCSRESMYEYLIKIAKSPRKHVLTDTLLETLSIVAYKQPVTRMEIEKVRGVNCDHAINRLIEFDLVKEVGRMDLPGKPLLFGTTQQFLRSFGVSSLDELPALNPMQLEEFKEQAEKEIPVSLGV
ncbi:MAG: SMC-Scp complex subunit ScpB [Eubacteriales bacterium]